MSETKKIRVTRGSGLLEPLLAQLRARRANRLIPDAHRTGRILDVGCGSYPYFLTHTMFREKFAIDQLPASTEHPDIHWHTLDLDGVEQLPFEDDFFDVVTLLAVIEHLSPEGLVELFRECRRALKTGGIVILTTPAAWSDRLLRLMARARLVSREEIEDHKFAYTLPLLGWYFGAAGFEMQKLEFGYFEFGLNMWTTARK